MFYPGGQAPAVGSLFVQRQFRRHPATHGRCRTRRGGPRRAGLQAARAMFYEGEIARRIVAFSERFGGFLQAEDLRAYHASFEEPIRTTFAGYEICTQSTWTQAAVLLQALNMLENVDLRALGHNSPAYVHTVTEVLKLAFADREHYYGDPNFAAVPIAGLLSKAYAAERFTLVSEHACPELPPYGDPGAFGMRARVTPLREPATPEAARAAAGEDGTTHLAALDRDGNMVCITPSGGVFRKSAFVPDLGCTLSTRSEMFFIDDDHPNGLQSGKRPRTTLINYFACRDGVPVMTFGCPGGDDQAQANLQMMLNVMVFGMNPQQAVEAPRFSTQSMTNSFYPRAYYPGVLTLEEGFA